MVIVVVMFFKVEKFRSKKIVKKIWGPKYFGSDSVEPKNFR